MGRSGAPLLQRGIEEAERHARPRGDDPGDLRDGHVDVGELTSGLTPIRLSSARRRHGQTGQSKPTWYPKLRALCSAALINVSQAAVYRRHRRFCTAIPRLPLSQDSGVLGSWEMPRHVLARPCLSPPARADVSSRSSAFLRLANWPARSARVAVATPEAVGPSAGARPRSATFRGEQGASSRNGSLSSTLQPLKTWRPRARLVRAIPTV